MFFYTCKTVDELKKEYRNLAKKYHPDISGTDTTDTMKAINAEYEKLFKQFNAAEGNKHKLDDGFREVIDRIINLDGIEIELCFKWLWVSGDTKPVKEILKAAGFKWAVKKMMWYWHPAEYSCFNNGKSKPMDYIRRAYGSEIIKGMSKPQRQALEELTAG